MQVTTGTFSHNFFSTIQKLFQQWSIIDLLKVGMVNFTDCKMLDKFENYLLPFEDRTAIILMELFIIAFKT